MITPTMKKSRPYSRLVENEQKRAVKQTIFFVTLSIGLLIAFLIIGLPLFFDFFIKLFGGGAIADQNKYPPQIPVLSAPLSATSSAQLLISGFTEAKAEVILIKNGSEVETVKADDNGGFEATISLSEGSNSITAYAKRGEQESDVGRKYDILLDTKKPSLDIEEPKENQVFESRENELLTIKGKTDAGSKVIINSRTVYPNAQGEFETTFRLSEGKNKLVFEAVDEANNSTKKEIEVEFKL